MEKNIMMFYTRKILLIWSTRNFQNAFLIFQVLLLFPPSISLWFIPLWSSGEKPSLNICQSKPNLFVPKENQSTDIYLLELIIFLIKGSVTLMNEK